MENPKLTVIILSYNHSEFIERCILSVCNQKVNFNLQISIYDDCSTDSTPEILHMLQVLDKRIILKLSDKNLGMMENGYRALKETSTEFVAILEGDDYYTFDEKLQVQYEFLKENPQVSLVGSNTSCFLNDEFVGRFNETKKNELNYISSWENISKIPFHTSTFFFRNILSSKDLDFFRNCVVGDIPLLYMLFQKGKVAMFSKSMTAYCRHAGGHTSNIDLREKQAFAQLIMYLRLAKYLGPKFLHVIVVKVIISGYSLYKFKLKKFIVNIST